MVNIFKESKHKNIDFDKLNFLESVSIIHKIYMVYLNKHLEELSITAGQFFLIICIYHNEGLSQDDLAKKLYMDKGTIARNLKKLEDLGIVSRKVDENNRRRNIIKLTDKGIELLPKIREIHNDLNNLLLEDVKNKEKFLRIIRKIAKKSEDFQGD